MIWFLTVTPPEVSDHTHFPTSALATSASTPWELTEGARAKAANHTKATNTTIRRTSILLGPPACDIIPATYRCHSKGEPRLRLEEIHIFRPIFFIDM